MTAFSRVEYNKKVVLKKIQREKQRIKNNPDAQIKRPAEARDANDGKYTLLIKRVKEETEKKQQIFADRIAKRNLKK